MARITMILILSTFYLDFAQSQQCNLKMVKCRYDFHRGKEHYTSACKNKRMKERCQYLCNNCIKHDCKADYRICAFRLEYLCKKFQRFCPNKCKVTYCNSIGTKTKAPPSTTTIAPTQTTKQFITTITTRAPPQTMQPPIRARSPTPFSGVCGDKYAFCIQSIFNAALDCENHISDCAYTCGLCSNAQNTCANLKDRDPNCSLKNCRISDRVKRYRTHTNCARTCCERKQMY